MMSYNDDIMLNLIIACIAFFERVILFLYTILVELITTHSLITSKSTNEYNNSWLVIITNSRDNY